MKNNLFIEYMNALKDVINSNEFNKYKVAFKKFLR